MTEPLRTCAGCGRRAPKHELYRFVARSEALQLARPGDPGRGVYTCRRLFCFERAAARRAFSRTLRASVTIEPELVRLYTDRDG